MEESAATLRELGIDPLMVEATVARQREMGAIGKEEKVRETLDKGRVAMHRRRQRRQGQARAARSSRRPDFVHKNAKKAAKPAKKMDKKSDAKKPAAKKDDKKQ